MSTLDLFKEIARTNYNKYLAEAKAKGVKIIGYFCNVPEEIIIAGGMIPYRIRTVESTKTTLGDIWYSTINCSFPRNCMDQLLEGKFDFFDGLVVMNSCDHVRRLYDNCKHGNIGPKFLYMFPAPHVITPESIKQSKREIIRLKSALEKHFGVEITQDKIKEAIATCNETRKLLSSLYELRKKDSPPIKGSEVLSVVLACTALPKNVVNESLKMLLTELTGRKVVPEGTPRLMIAAGLLEEVDYMELLEKDAIIVADSLCFGSRYWRNLVDEDGDSIEALAYRYGSIACPRMVESYDKRIELLNDDIREYRTDGLIVDNLKFCLHWQLFRFMIENEVESGVRLSCPLLVFERELHTSATGQVKTRVQAFLELLRERKPSNTSVKN